MLRRDIKRLNFYEVRVNRDERYFNDSFVLNMERLNVTK